jgi:hypothetical protein
MMNWKGSERKCRGLIEVLSRICMQGLKEVKTDVRIASVSVEIRTEDFHEYESRLLPLCQSAPQRMLHIPPITCKFI